MAIHLAVGTPVDGNPLRNAEYGECLKKNLSNPFISRVHILLEERPLPEKDNRRLLLEHPKAVIHHHGRRSTYDDHFDVLSAADHDSTKILANADTYFDFTLGNIRGLSLTNRVLFITRVDHVRIKFGFCGSDAWVFQSRPQIKADFNLGYDWCDFRLFEILEEAGYEILNPAFSVRLWHIHNHRRPRSIRERYDCGGAPQRITICHVHNGIISDRETVEYDYPPELRRKKSRQPRTAT